MIRLRTLLRIYEKNPTQKVKKLKVFWLLKLPELQNNFVFGA
jgi:hypothetical protein